MECVNRATCSSDESVVGHTSNAEPLPWPPTVESLQKRLEEMHSLLTKFFELLISPEGTHHATAETASRLAESVTQDIVLQYLKHTALGIGLHSITGLKLPIIMLSRFCHFIMNNTVREVKTVQAVLLVGQL